MSTTESSANPVSQQDVAVLIGVVAIIEGQVMGGRLDAEVTRTLTDRFLRAGLLAPGPDGQQPSAGRLAVAMEDLVQRLRYAYGDYKEPVKPSRLATSHVLGFATEDAANACREALADDAQSLHIRAAGTRGWQLYATYPELRPDPGFREREQELQQVAARFGGTYVGT